MLSHSTSIQLFVILCTIAHQAPQSMESPGKNTGVGCHSILQRIFPTQAENPGLPHCRKILYHLSHQESVKSSMEIAYYAQTFKFFEIYTVI